MCNADNFVELLKYRADAVDKLLQEHLSSPSRNATYIIITYHELIIFIGRWIQGVIVKRLHGETGLFFNNCRQKT